MGEAPRITAGCQGEVPDDFVKAKERHATSHTPRRSERDGGAPLDGDALHAVKRFLEEIAGAGKREP